MKWDWTQSLLNQILERRSPVQLVSNGKEETGEQLGRRKGKKDRKEMEQDGEEDSYHLYSLLGVSRAERVPLPSDKPSGYSELVSTLIIVLYLLGNDSFKKYM